MKHPAFYLWLLRESDGERVRIAEILRETLLTNHPASMVWDLLAATGDERYNYNTFLKAADLIIAEKEHLCVDTDQK